MPTNFQNLISIFFKIPIKKIVDYFVWGLVFSISGFAFTVYATKDLLPNSRFYPIKLGMEKIIAAGSAFLNKEVDWQINLVNRRFQETAKVLKLPYAKESLIRLNAHIRKTTESINNIKNEKQKKEAAEKYITELTFIAENLKTQQKKFLNPSSISQPSFANTQNLTQFSTPTLFTQNQNQNNFPPYQTNNSQNEVFYISEINKQIETINQTIQQSIEKIKQEVNLSNPNPNLTPTSPPSTTSPTPPSSIQNITPSLKQTMTSPLNEDQNNHIKNKEKRNKQNEDNDRNYSEQTNPEKRSTYEK
jgi:hypothetical protein